jgi:thiol-disulfide isomerase/thioredoxin
MSNFLPTLAIVAASLVQAPDQAAWDAAAALKKRADYAGAAAAYEQLHAKSPQAPRAVEALVEAGVCWFSDGRSKLDLRRVTDEARASFERSLARLDDVTADHAKSPHSSRAQYMKGSVRLFMGELEASRLAYAGVLDSYSLDRSYVGKALERHASVQRHLLRPREALSDMRRWAKEFGAPADTLAAVNKQIALTAKLEKPAPAYTAEVWVQGEPAPMELMGGHVVALYFFATWCPNCAKETPYLIDLERRFGERGLKVIGVMDGKQGQTPDSIRAHLAANKIPFTVMMDAGQAAEAYGATSIPFVALIDADGKLRWTDNPANLCDWTVEALLNGQPLQK